MGALGILGGTFDPIHLGHLRPALEVHEALGLDQIRLIPCHVPPHRRRPITEAADRLRMVELAAEGERVFAVDRRELERQGPSYSFDTLYSLRKDLGQRTGLFLVMGMDAFAGLPGWHRWDELIELAHIVVTHRPGSPASSDIDLGDWLESVRTDDVQAVRGRPSGNVIFCPVTQLDISATDIRRRIRAGKSARFLVPDSVWRYICERGLYSHS